jgi:gluconate 2-dehydrogenase gamma chain
MNPGNSSRRHFLLGSASGLSSAWLALRWPAILAAQAHAQHAAESGQPAAFQFFTPEQAVEIEAVTAQIIPSDHGPSADAPGAREARVVYFIDRALTTFDSDKQPAYTQGLNDLQHKTRELFPSANTFSSLTSEQQIQLLTAIEKTEFFELVRVHTIMGYLSSPDYGGNHDQAGWKLIGFQDEMTFKPPFGYYDSEYNKAR